MAEPRLTIRGFLRKHRKTRHTSDDDDNNELRVPRASASATSSFSSTTGPEGDVAMEGPLKKRVAKMPVMHDRYCVATWEIDANDAKCVMLRSYKSRKNYDAHPERPSSAHQLKCISDWDGKTGFHRYQHAFTMETRDKKLFQCVAPNAVDKDKWLELMAIQSAFQTGRDMRLNSIGNLVPLRRTQSVESGKPRAYTDASLAKSDVTDFDEVGGHDGLFRKESDASTRSLEPNGDKNEPADWGLFGEDGETKSKYEVQEDAKPVMLLDKELLNARGQLATDSYLFEDGASRFGAVVVKAAADSEEEDSEFVDEQFAAREARKEQEKSMRRRAQKLESNRDLYAEMAAKRLAGMRKEARHPRKSLSQSRPSIGSEESDEEEARHLRKSQSRHSAYSEESDSEEARHLRKSLSHSRPSEESDAEEEQDQSMVAEEEAEVEVESVAELEEMTQRYSSRGRHSSKSHKKSFVSSEDTISGGYASGDDDEVEEEDELPVAAPAEMTEVEPEEAEELRQLKKKYRAERRAKKRFRKEKEERAALQAAEMARAHREEQRAREETKLREEQEKRDKKERREMKEKLKREKGKQRQAEAELRKLVELKQAEEERREREHKEKKERKEKKKSKKKEKYTSPAERIQKKEERDAERAAAVVAEAEVSNALVVVEKPAEPEPAQQPLAAPEPAPTPAPTSTSSVQTEAEPATVTAPAPVVAPAPAPGGATAPPQAMPMYQVAPASGGVAAPPQAMPMYQVAPPPFVPMYPPGPQGMPAYGLAATFGAYPPHMYPSPYSYGAPVGPQPTYMRPNMGFMAGLSAMGSFGKAAGPEPAPSSQDFAEPLIGPQLPTAEERAAVSSTGASAPTPPPSAVQTSAKLTNLPELPDVVEF